MSVDNSNISWPSLPVKTRAEVRVDERKKFLRKGALTLVLSIIAAAGGIFLYLTSQGLAPHCFNAISHAIGQSATKGIGLAALPVGAIGASFSVLALKQIFINTVRGEILHRHFFDRISKGRRNEIARFNSSLVCTLMNTPKISTVGGNGIQSTFCELRCNFAIQVKEALESDVTGSKHSKFEEVKEEFLQVLDSYKKEKVSGTKILDTTQNGICFGFVMHIAKRVLNGESIEKVCQEFKGGGNEEITALQYLYKTAPREVILTGEQTILATLGLEASEIETVEEEGIYAIGMDMPITGRHEILMQISKNHVYLLDPNYFLIKFDKSTFGSDIRKFLALYYATAENMPVESFDFESVCKGLEIYKLSLNIDSRLHATIDDGETFKPFLYWGKPEDIK